ncbi:MAG: hypothetical protein ACRC0X_10325 [Brevinema sp.]
MVRFLSFLLICIIVLTAVHTQDYEEYEYYDEYAGYYDEGYSDYYDEYYDEYTEIAEEPTLEIPIEPPITNDLVPNLEEQTVTNIFIPILQTYRSPIVVDPNDPKLPGNHHLVKLRGMVWRSDGTVLRTNSRGVVSEQRLFIFFDKERDAIAYQYAFDRSTPMWPEKGSFIPLFPLLWTNDFVPVPSVPDPLSNTNMIQGSIQYIVEPLIMRNYQYEKVLELLMNQAQERITDKRDFDTVHTNTMVTTNVSRRGIIIVTNTTMSVITNITRYDFDRIIEVQQSGVTNIIQETNIINKDINTNDEISMIPSSISGIVQSMYLLPLKVFAQEVLLDNQYIETIGGASGGIFIHETGDSDNPYQIIFLSLDEGMYLYEYNMSSPFDVRDSTIQASQQARELYIRILNERINMRRFQQVPINKVFFE